MATQVEKVTLLLRDIIVGGEFEPDARIPEVAIAARLGVSRTPVRLALGQLENEGLVTGSPNRGFRVRGFSVEDILSAYEVRGLLESLACKKAAESGLSAETKADLNDCLAVGDELLELEEWDDNAVQRWCSMNNRFHRTVLHAANSAALEAAFGAVARFPAADPGTIIFLSNRKVVARATLAGAHAEHHVIADAIANGQASRAEYLMKEHVYISSVNIKNVLERERGRLPRLLDIKRNTAANAEARPDDDLVAPAHRET